MIDMRYAMREADCYHIMFFMIPEGWFIKKSRNNEIVLLSKIQNGTSVRRHA